MDYDLEQLSKANKIAL